MTLIDKKVLSEELHKSVDVLQRRNEKNKVVYASSLKENLETRFPGKQWWEITSNNIDYDLFENVNNPHAVVDNIVEGIDDNIGIEEIEYKGYYISYNFYNNDEYTVQVDGDDVVFDTVDEAKEFIDSLSGDYQIEEDCGNKDNKGITRSKRESLQLKESSLVEAPIGDYSDYNIKEPTSFDKLAFAHDARILKRNYLDKLSAAEPLNRKDLSIISGAIDFVRGEFEDDRENKIKLLKQENNKSAIADLRYGYSNLCDMISASASTLVKAPYILESSSDSIIFGITDTPILVYFADKNEFHSHASGIAELGDNGYRVDDISMVDTYNKAVSDKNSNEYRLIQKCLDINSFSHENDEDKINYMMIKKFNQKWFTYEPVLNLKNEILSTINESYSRKNKSLGLKESYKKKFKKNLHESIFGEFDTVETVDDFLYVLDSFIKELNKVRKVIATGDTETIVDKLYLDADPEDEEEVVEELADYMKIAFDDYMDDMTR